MRRWNLVIAVAVVALGLAVPLALAADNCMAMGPMCEGPCGASSCAVTQFGSDIALDPIAAANTPLVEHVPSAPPTALKHPPRSSPSLV